MVTYIIVTHNKQKDVLETTKPFFSHEDAEKEMWERYAKELTKIPNNPNFTPETAKKFADENNIDYSEYYINDSHFYETEIHSVLFNEDDMLTMHILEVFYKKYPDFADYKKGEWRAKFQDILVNIINHTLHRYKESWLVDNDTDSFIEDVLIGEELYQLAVAELGGDANRTEDILTYINENPKFTQFFKNEYEMKDSWLCGMMVLSSGDENAIKEIRGAINEWCKETNTAPIFVEPNYVYRVSAYYDMDIMVEEEIIQEIYATEELAQKRVRYLIDTYKSNSHAIEDCEPYGGEWDEDEYHLYAFMDSEWNVDISYVKEEVRTKI